MPVPGMRGTLVALTGASGTVGSAVVAKLLRAGARIRALVRTSAPPGTEAIVGDLEHQPALTALAQGATAVIHCAAALNDDPVECRRTNVEGTQRVAEAAYAAGAKLIHLSTVSVYAHRKTKTLDENSMRLDGSPEDYGTSKAEGERIVERLGERGLPYVILRPVAVLSMHSRSYWGPLALERAREDPAPIVPVAEFPYVHVDNLAEAVLLATCNDAALRRSYNVVDGHGPTNEYLQAVAKAIGQPPRLLAEGAPTVRYSGKRIRDELGYAPVDRFSEFVTQLGSWRM